MERVLIPEDPAWNVGIAANSAGSMSKETADLTNGVDASELRSRLAAIIESSDDAIISKDLEGTITSWNHGAENLFGYAAEEAIGRPDAFLIPEDRQDEEPEILGRIRRGEWVDHFETTRRRKDGRLVDVSLTISPIRNGEGVIVGASKIAREVGRQKQADLTARRLAAIVESSEDAIISKDLNSVIQTWNAGAEALFGYTADEAIGRSVTMLIPPEARDEEPGIVARIRAGQRIDHYETTRVRKDGSLVEVSLTVSPIRDFSGEVVGASKIARDISERRTAQRALEAAHETALAASRAKDEFLAALSHELRTPLNPVLLLASSGAEDASLPEGVREDFTTIRKNIELEARLIDDLLDITRITRGKLPLRLAPQNLHAVLEDALATMGEDIAQKKLSLSFALHALNPVVVADAVRLQQVFWNLLKNAVKFTPERGTISIKSRLDGARRRVVLEVADTGIGITEEERGRLFNAFSQGDHAAMGGSHLFGGLGLGLTISRMLTEMHHGTITAASEGRDRGSTFTIDLPLMTTEQAAAFNRSAGNPRPPEGEAADGHTTERRPRVLLVEDHVATRETLERLLVKRRFDVVAAANAEEARARFKEGGIDILISDIGLPDAKGYELMAEMAVGRSLPGIALTGYGMEDDVLLSGKAGFQSHLTKPVTIQALDTALAKARASLASRG
jgi:PAS domain S-box-containing protein